MLCRISTPSVDQMEAAYAEEYHSSPWEWLTDPRLSTPTRTMFMDHLINVPVGDPPKTRRDSVGMAFHRPPPPWCKVPNSSKPVYWRVMRTIASDPPGFDEYPMEYHTREGPRWFCRRAWRQIRKYAELRRLIAETLNAIIAHAPMLAIKLQHYYDKFMTRKLVFDYRNCYYVSQVMDTLIVYNYKEIVRYCTTEEAHGSNVPLKVLHVTPDILKSPWHTCATRWINTCMIHQLTHVDPEDIPKAIKLLMPLYEAHEIDDESRYRVVIAYTYLLNRITPLIEVRERVNIPCTWVASMLSYLTGKAAFKPKYCTVVLKFIRANTRLIMRGHPGITVASFLVTEPDSVIHSMTLTLTRYVHGSLASGALAPKFTKLFIDIIKTRAMLIKITDVDELNLDRSIVLFEPTDVVANVRRVIIKSILIANFEEPLTLEETEQQLSALNTILAYLTEWRTPANMCYVGREILRAMFIYAIMSNSPKDESLPVALVEAIMVSLMNFIIYVSDVAEEFKAIIHANVYHVATAPGAIESLLHVLGAEGRQFIEKLARVAGDIDNWCVDEFDDVVRRIYDVSPACKVDVELSTSLLANCTCALELVITMLFSNAIPTQTVAHSLHAYKWLALSLRYIHEQHAEDPDVAREVALIMQRTLVVISEFFRFGWPITDQAVLEIEDKRDLKKFAPASMGWVGTELFACLCGLPVVTEPMAMQILQRYVDESGAIVLPEFVDDEHDTSVHHTLMLLNLCCLVDANALRVLVPRAILDEVIQTYIEPYAGAHPATGVLLLEMGLALQKILIILWDPALVDILEKLMAMSIQSLGVVTHDDTTPTYAAANLTAGWRLFMRIHSDDMSRLICMDSMLSYSTKLEELVNTELPDYMQGLSYTIRRIADDHGVEMLTKTQRQLAGAKAPANGMLDDSDDDVELEDIPDVSYVIRYYGTVNPKWINMTEYLPDVVKRWD